MANKYPLTVNTTFNRIEELALGDNLDLSNSGIYANGSVGTAGQTLASNGSSVYWSTPVSVDWSSPGSLGSNTANAATFTTLSTTGTANLNYLETQNGIYDYSGISTEGSFAGYGLNTANGWGIAWKPTTPFGGTTQGFINYDTTNGFRIFTGANNSVSKVDIATTGELGIAAAPITGYKAYIFGTGNDNALFARVANNSSVLYGGWNTDWSLVYRVTGLGNLFALGNVTIGTQTATAKLTVAGDVATGNTRITGSLTSNGSIITNVVTVAASAIDCNTGTYFTKTATGALTWTVSNVPASGAYSFILELTNGGTGTQTWMTGTKWPGGTAPTLVASGVDVLGFITDDGGTTWRGVHIMADSK